MTESLVVNGDMHVGTLFVVPEISPAIVAAASTKQAPRSPQSAPSDQLTFDESLTSVAETSSILAEPAVDEFTDYDRLSDEDKELADYGEKLLAQQTSPEVSFVARNKYLQAMFPLISIMNSMKGISKGVVLPADSLVGADITKRTVEQNAKNLLAAACGSCALSESCRIQAFYQWNRTHPRETRYASENKSKAGREKIELQVESREEFKSVLAENPSAHCNPDQR